MIKGFRYESRGLLGPVNKLLNMEYTVLEPLGSVLDSTGCWTKI